MINLCWLFLITLGVSIFAFLHQVRPMAVEVLIIFSDKLWKEAEVTQDCRKDLVMHFFKKGNAGKKSKELHSSHYFFISGHRHLEDKKIMNRQHQVIVSHPEALARFSADERCQTEKGMSMKQSDWDALEGSGTLKSMTVSAHRWGLLAWEAALKQFPICQAGAPKGPHCIPLPARILPCLSVVRTAGKKWYWHDVQWGWGDSKVEALSYLHWKCTGIFRNKWYLTFLAQTSKY